MKPLRELDPSHISFLFTDIDDTLTSHAKLHASAYSALWNLANAGVQIVPITGRPAGWCDMIARFWPVTGVIGENGGLYFRYHNKQMKRRYGHTPQERARHQAILARIGDEILSVVPEARLSADQFARQLDLAIDICEDIAPLSPAAVEKIKQIFLNHGATVKVSSIHVNGWFGSYDKLSMCKEFLRQEFGLELDQSQTKCLFVGDSPNDEPMFGYFHLSVGVANVRRYLDQLRHPPRFVTTREGGEGFVELSEHILSSLKAQR